MMAHIYSKTLGTGQEMVQNIRLKKTLEAATKEEIEAQ